MNLYSLYNLRFKNKKVDEWYNRLFVRVANLLLPIYYCISGLFVSRELKTSGNLNSSEKYIVSLTSFPARIDKLWLVIESILRQKEKPDAIIIWLYKGEFDGKSSLPKSLLSFEKWIQIEFCDENLMPHKKYFYTMEQYPQANVITVDDDVIYPSHLIGDLKAAHKKYPKSICSTITRSIKVENGGLKSYSEWTKAGKKMEQSYQLLQIGAGGVLYPPRTLHAEVFNKEILIEKALYADDLWLKVMGIKNDTKTVSISNYKERKFFPVYIKNNKQLIDSNVGEGRNDKIIRAILKHYGLSNLIFKKRKKEDQKSYAQKTNHYFEFD